MEWQDVLDKDRRPTGRLHRRGEPLAPGDYVAVACAWIGDSRGRLLLTRRAPEKLSCPGMWENSGGAVQAGETSAQGIAREVREETGISARPEEFELLGTFRGQDAFYDLYFLRRDIPAERLTMQPGETTEAKWVTPGELREMIDRGVVAPPIARRFRMQEQEILERLGGEK